MSKTKNKSQSGKPYRLNDAVLQYHAKNYTGALSRLRAATIRPEEVQKAKQLEYILLLRVAFHHLQLADYNKTIATLQVLPETDVPTQLLKGIAYLYLLQYEAAIPCLQKAAKNYPIFSAYVILAHLHSEQNIDFQSFIDKFPTDWANCSEQQKKYIQTAHLALKGAYSEALALANTFKTESHFQHLNWEALKVILTPNAAALPAVNEKVKTWYRMLLHGAMKDFEQTYLKSLGENTQDVLNAALPTQKPLAAHLQKVLKEQYSAQKVLEDSSLHSLLELVPKAQRPFIVYNQLANICNHKDGKSLKTAKYIFTKYISDFAVIPESLNLIMFLYELEDFDATPNHFWSFMKQWMSCHKDNLSIEQTDALGWRLLTLWMEYPELCVSHHLIEWARLSRELPTAFALKFALMTHHALQQPVKNITDTRLDLFSLPNAEKSKENFLSFFDNINKAMSPYVNRGFFDFLHDVPPLSKPKYIQQIVYWAESLILAATQYPVLPKNWIWLEAFKFVHEQIREIQLNKGVLPPDLYQRFLNTYQTVIQQFRPSEALDVFKLDWDYSIYGKYVLDFALLVDKAKSYSDYEKFLAKCKDAPTFVFIWEHFAKLMRRTHFNEQVADQLSQCLTAVLYHFKQNVATAQKEIHLFVNIYKQTVEKHPSPSSDTFFAILIQNIIKVKFINVDITYLFAKSYILELTLKNSLEPKNYNAVAVFLEWMKSQKYYNNPAYNKPFAHALWNYLKAVNEQKNLKKLDKVLDNTAKWI
jgi:hypothetical protein